MAEGKSSGGCGGLVLVALAILVVGGAFLYQLEGGRLFVADTASPSNGTGKKSSVPLFDSAPKFVMPSKKLDGLWTLLGQTVRFDGSGFKYESGSLAGKVVFSGVSHSSGDTFTGRLQMDDGGTVPATFTLLDPDTVLVTLDTSSRSFWNRPLWSETRMTRVK